MLLAYLCFVTTLMSLSCSGNPFPSAKKLPTVNLHIYLPKDKSKGSYGGGWEEKKYDSNRALNALDTTTGSDEAAVEAAAASDETDVEAAANGDDEAPANDQAPDEMGRDYSNDQPQDLEAENKKGKGMDDVKEKGEDEEEAEEAEEEEEKDSNEEAKAESEEVESGRGGGGGGTSSANRGLPANDLPNNDICENVCTSKRLNKALHKFCKCGSGE